MVTSPEECQNQQMIRNTKAEFNDPTIADDAPTMSETDLHVVMVKKSLIERIDCFVDGLLCGE